MRDALWEQLWVMTLEQLYHKAIKDHRSERILESGQEGKSVAGGRIGGKDSQLLFLQADVVKVLRMGTQP